MVNKSWTIYRLLPVFYSGKRARIEMGLGMVMVQYSSVNLVLL